MKNFRNTFFVLLAFSVQSVCGQSEKKSEITFSIQGGGLFFTQNESPALLQVMYDRFADDNQTQSTGIDPSNEQSYWIEFKMSKPVIEKWSLDARVSYRNFNEDEFVIYSDEMNNTSETGLIYKTTETHISAGLNLNYEVLQTKKGFGFKTYMGIDARKSQLSWREGRVQYASPFSVEYPQMDEVLRNYRQQTIFVDPLVGLTVSKSPLYVDARFQKFVKNSLEGINNFYPDYRDNVYMTSLALGVQF